MTKTRNREHVMTWLSSKRETINFINVWISVNELYDRFKNDLNNGDSISYGSFSKQLSSIEQRVDYLDKTIHRIENGTKKGVFI